MLFSNNIPDKLQEYPTVSAFVSVLDSLQNYKSEIIGDSFRVHNPAVLMDRKWLLKKLYDLGVTDFPEDYPLEIIQQFILNAETVFRTRGSKIGLELYCSILTLGSVSIQDSEFYEESSTIQLDSFSQGYITGDNSNKSFYIVSDNSEINPETSLSVEVSTPFSDNDVVKDYLKNTIRSQIGFGNVTISLSFKPLNTKFYHKLLNPYFI